MIDVLLDGLFWIAKKTDENSIIIGIITLFATCYFFIKWIYKEE